MISNPSITAVYRKSSKVKGLWRVRELDLIAGEEKTKTIHKEHGIRIVVDIDKAYFSPRLATEHNRVSELIDQGLVLDMFGSLAPFALHLTKQKEIIVDTLDINPFVPQLINESIQLNNLKGTINIITADAHEYAYNNSKSYDWIIMNHPSGAYDFLSDAINLIKVSGRILYYDFISLENFETEVKEKLSAFKNIVIEDIHIVRQSSPSEYHLCVLLMKI